MKTDALITVIVPVYNGQVYLAGTFESLQYQTIFDQLHILFVDDGSTDQSYEACLTFQKLYPDQVTVLKNERNRGVSYTRSRALKAVHTKYVTFLDCDDRLHPRIYERMLELAQEHRASIACINTAVQKGTQLNYQQKEKVVCYTSEQAFEDLILPKHLTNSNCDKLYRTDICSMLSFDERFSIGEDMLFNYEAIANATKIVCDLGEPYYYYVQQETSAMNAPFTARFFDTITVLEEVKMRYANTKRQKDILECRIAYEKAKIVERLLSSHITEYDALQKQYVEEIRKVSIPTLLRHFTFERIIVVLSTALSPHLYLRLIQLKRRIRK